MPTPLAPHAQVVSNCLVRVTALILELAGTDFSGPPRWSHHDRVDLLAGLRTLEIVETDLAAGRVACALDGVLDAINELKRYATDTEMAELRSLMSTLESLVVEDDQAAEHEGCGPDCGYDRHDDDLVESALVKVLPWGRDGIERLAVAVETRWVLP